MGPPVAGSSSPLHNGSNSYLVWHFDDAGRPASVNERCAKSHGNPTAEPCDEGIFVEAFLENRDVMASFGVTITDKTLMNEDAVRRKKELPKQAPVQF